MKYIKDYKDLSLTSERLAWTERTSKGDIVFSALNYIPTTLQYYSNAFFSAVEVREMFNGRNRGTWWYRIKKVHEWVEVDPENRKLALDLLAMFDRYLNSAALPVFTLAEVVALSFLLDEAMPKRRGFAPIHRDIYDLDMSEYEHITLEALLVVKMARQNLVGDLAIKYGHGFNKSYLWTLTRGGKPYFVD